MEENEKITTTPADQDKVHDCGCEGNCCPPKKNNRFVKIIFAFVILAALGVIGVKLFNQPAPAAASEACCPPGSTGCDTTKTAACDTAKGSSCCPKN